MIDIIRYSMLLYILIRESIRDIRDREIDIGVPIAYGIVVIVFNLIPEYGNIKSCIGGALLGSIVLIIALIKKESIGPGDGIMLIITGASLGAYLNLVLIIRAIIFAGIGGIVLILLRKRRKMAADTMPLMPYILLSYMTICVSCFYPEWLQ